MKAGIFVGLDKDAIKATLPALTDSILKVMNTAAGDEVKKTAITALAGSVEVKNVSISNCQISGK